MIQRGSGKQASPATSRSRSTSSGFRSKCAGTAADRTHRAGTRVHSGAATADAARLWCHPRSMELRPFEISREGGTMVVHRLVLVALAAVVLVTVAPEANGGGGTAITTCGQVVTTNAFLYQ